MGGVVTELVGGFNNAQRRAFAHGQPAIEYPVYGCRADAGGDGNGMDGDFGFHGLCQESMQSMQFFVVGILMVLMKFDGFIWKNISNT